MVYGRNDVAGACLAAQDRHGLDVNLLLFAAWLASTGHALDGSDARLADEHCRAWREDVVEPLRRRRRAWKHAAPHDRAYAAIKALEIEAERQQLAMLADLAVELRLQGALPAAQASSATELLAANLRVVAAASGATDAAVAGLAAALDDGDEP